MMNGHEIMCNISRNLIIYKRIKRSRFSLHFFTIPYYQLIIIRCLRREDFALSAFTSFTVWRLLSVMSLNGIYSCNPYHVNKVNEGNVLSFITQQLDNQAVNTDVKK